MQITTSILAPVYKVLIHPPPIWGDYHALSLNAAHGSGSIICKPATYWWWRWGGHLPRGASEAIFFPNDTETARQTHVESCLAKPQTFQRFSSGRLSVCAFFNQSVSRCTTKTSHFPPPDAEGTPSPGDAPRWPRLMEPRGPPWDAQKVGRLVKFAFQKIQMPS